MQIYPPIKLATGSDSAALVYGTWNEDNLQKFQDCTFFVDSSLYHSENSIVARGLTFSIRRMNFRLDATTGECIDYVRFTFGGSGAQTDKICGAFDGGDSEYAKYFHLLDPSGVIKVHIFVDKTVPYQMTQRHSEVEFAFTAYELLFFILIILFPKNRIYLHFTHKKTNDS